MSDMKTRRLLSSLFMFPQRLLQQGLSQDETTTWRAQAIRVVLIGVAIIGLPAWGSVFMDGLLKGEMSPLLWIYVAVYASVITLAILPRIDHRLRIWGLLILAYANGCASLFRLGLMGSGRLYLLLIPVFTMVLIGTRAGIAASLISLVTYIFFATQVGVGETQAWVEAGTALAAFLISTVILLDRFSQFLLQTLRKERQTRNQLEVAQAELEAYSHELEEKVQERTASLETAKQQAEAANKRYEQELLVAGQIQTSFMAAELPEIPAWESAATLIPARETSGDFYDIFSLPGEQGNRYGILIADVVDKGVGAALFMALNWALLHTYAHQYPNEPARVFAAANRRILRDTHAGQFVTVFYGVLDPRTGVLLYANAGHPPPYRFWDGKLSTLERTGAALGIFEDGQWEQKMVRFQPGDLCLFYTDGITEAQNVNRHFFEVNQLARLLQKMTTRSAEEIRGALISDLMGFIGDNPHQDDITLLVLKYLTDTAHVKLADH
jgi:serine phosphatase RsbU (regulator of sigma subunit)